MLLKPGMVVKIKEDIYIGYPCKVGCASGMEDFAGKKVVVDTTEYTTYWNGKEIVVFKIKEDDGEFYWDTELVEYVLNPKRNATLFGEEFYAIKD